MGCWVAPTIAAELWGVSVRYVLDLVQNGRVASRQDGNFQFVRLPHYAAFGEAIPLEHRPSTYNIITAGELAALTAEPPAPAEEPDPAEQDGFDPEMGPPPEEDPHDDRIGGWRAGRRKTAMIRRPPPRLSQA